MDLAKIEAATKLLLEGLGVPHDHNFHQTPHRVARMMQEIFSPPEIDIPVFDEDYTDVVVMRGHVFYTLCPHHLLPVKLRASVAYIPNGKVIGASKLMRIMHDCNRYPMTQEKLTQAVLDRILDLTNHTSSGAAIYMVGQHGCFQVRGVRSHDAEMVTYKFSGVFKEDTEQQRRFLELAR